MGKGSGALAGYPKRIVLILLNEFCERYSFYGMKAILVLYLTRALKYTDNSAVAIYHAFSAVTYFTPLFGAMIADGWLGKYKTILYVSIIYGIGNIAMAVTAIPFNGSYITWGVFIGLVLIAIGAGGIKPCVSAFGGDQFKPDQVRQKESFFSLFYMFINIGSLLTTIVSPYVRSNVFCFHDNCYTLAFGIPAALMVCSIILFVIGTPFYTRNPPGESILQRIFGCVWTALKRKIGCGSRQHEKKDHWLDHAEPEYDKKFIADVKDVMGVLWLFLPLPFFWALYDQQGSRWTLQATQMNGNFGSFVVEPDMMGTANALLVVIFAPFLEVLVFPCLDKLRVPNKPLQRMAAGMILCASSFLIAAGLQIVINNSVPEKPGEGFSKVIFLNSAPCSTNLQLDDYTEAVGPLQTTEYVFVSAGRKQLTLTWEKSCPWGNGSEIVEYEMEQKKTYKIVTVGNIPSMNSTLITEQTLLDRTTDSTSTFRVFNGLQYPVTIRLAATKSQEEDKILRNVTSYSFSDPVQLVIADFNVFANESRLSEKLVSRNGAIYNVLLAYSPDASDANNITLRQLTDVGPWPINMFLQVPQYAVLSMGECLFSITGLAFAYTQAPASMKSLLTAAWLLTIAVGDLVIIIVSEAAGETSDQSIIFFVFAGVLYAVTVVFAIMSWYYKYVEPAAAAPVDEKAAPADDSSSSSSSQISDGVAAEKYGLPAYVGDDVTAGKQKSTPSRSPSLRKASAVVAPAPFGGDEEKSKPAKTLTWSDKKSPDVDDDAGHVNKASTGDDTVDVESSKF